MGVIIRMYGLDILTSVVGTGAYKYHFKDKQQALWAAYMATELLNLHHCIRFDEPAQTDVGDYTVGVQVREHDVQDSPKAFHFKGWLIRLEYQTNLKHMFDPE